MESVFVGSSLTLDQFTLPKAQAITRWLLAFVYVPFGLFHILSPTSFLPIMPRFVPAPLQMVVFTGACEVLGAIGLLILWTRRPAGVMLAIYAVCVWPANIYQALAHVHVPPLPDSWWYHGPRLAFQLVMIWAPLFGAGVTGWPLAERARARTRRRAGCGRAA